MAYNESKICSKRWLFVVYDDMCVIEDRLSKIKNMMNYCLAQTEYDVGNHRFYVHGFIDYKRAINEGNVRFHLDDYDCLVLRISEFDRRWLEGNIDASFRVTGTRRLEYGDVSKCIYQLVKSNISIIDNYNIRRGKFGL